MKLKPHQIGIIIALAVAAVFVAFNIWGQASGVAIEHAKREAQAAQ